MTDEPEQTPADGESRPGSPAGIDGAPQPGPDTDASPKAATAPAADSRWLVAGASVVGTSHVARGAICQDAHAYLVRPDGVLLVAVADGAGSAERSAEGARISVERTIEVLDGGLDRHLREHDDAPDANAWRQLMTDAVDAARRRIDDLASSAALSPRSFACTLTCVAVARDRLAVAQIGDAAAVARDGEGNIRTVGVPQRGEYANEAFFVTMTDAMTRLEITVTDERATAVAALSDGLLRVATQGRDHEAHAPFFEPLLSVVTRLGGGSVVEAKLAAFLDSERVNKRTDDDKTLVLAVRSP